VVRREIQEHAYANSPLHIATGSVPSTLLFGMPQYRVHCPMPTHCPLFEYLLACFSTAGEEKLRQPHTLIEPHGSDIEAILREEYGIHRIPISSRMFGFVVNSFFVEKPYPTLVDVPPDEGVYLDKLQSGLEKAGHSLKDIRRIIVTHPHFDHFGSARTISETSGAELWASERGAAWFEDFEEQISAEERFRHELLLDSNATDTEIQEVDNYYRKATPLARSIKPVKYLKEGDRFELSSLVFTVTAVPGHTPWCILLHDVENRLGFSGDFLQSVTSNPLIQRNTKALPSYNSLKSYTRSLEKICAMGLQTVLAGHGEIIENGSKKAQDILGVIQQRREAILHILGDSSHTLVEIGRTLFPDLLPGRLFNAICEIVSHLELIEEEGFVVRVGNQPTRYALP